MKDIILSILQIALWVIPASFGIAFLIRSNDSYEDSYSRSSWNMWGVSHRKYRAFFRLFGLFLIILSAVIFYFVYLYEPANPLDEYRDFWNNSDPAKGENFIFKTAMLMSAIAIPARMASTRFPGKPLAMLGGKRVLERVYEKCAASKKAEKVFILTDSAEIEDFAKSMGANCIMTSPACKNGTERIVEALEKIDANFIVNVQGDEPFIPPSLIDSIFKLRERTNCQVATAAAPIRDADELFNPNNVKVLTNSAGNVIYFSRSPLPYVRGASDKSEWLKRSAYLKHIGIYGYTKQALKIYSSLPQSRLEACESLEQLRFVDAGIQIALVESDYKVVGIDTPEDLAEAEKLLKE